MTLLSSMKQSDLPNEIDHGRLGLKASRYGLTVKRDARRLEENCRGAIPRSLAERRANGDAFLSKADVTCLLHWKLSHGKYRPSLPGLLASNPEKTVEKITREAFSAYDKDPTDVAKPINTLATLKGVGPATASLILSRYDKVNVPFFSDELFRYMNFEEGKGKGWDRKIGYTMKEYKSLVERVGDLRRRLAAEGEDMEAEDVGRAAFVLYKEDMGELDVEGDKKTDSQQSAKRSHIEDDADGVGEKKPKKRRKDKA